MTVMFLLNLNCPLFALTLIPFAYDAYISSRRSSASLYQAAPSAPLDLPTLIKASWAAFIASPYCHDSWKKNAFNKPVTSYIPL